MVDNYTPNNCKYSIDKLEKKIYLLPKDTLSIVDIDRGEAYVKEPLISPILMEGFAISYSEETSLDERYQFSKEVKLSVRGYFPKVTFDDVYHILLKDKDNNYWVVNIDFPIDITYNFAMGNGQYQTDLTLKCLSNFPTLLLINDWGETPIEDCNPYAFNKLDNLMIIDRYDTALDVVNKKVYAFNGNDFANVVPIKNSISLQESYDGEKVSTQVQFSIKLSDYEKSYQYNLLEFMNNKKSIMLQSDDNVFFLGFNLGLTPQYNLNATTANDQNNTVEITLEEVSNEGSTVANDIEKEVIHKVEWKNVKYFGVLPCFECVSEDYAEFLLKEEYDVVGNSLGRYMCVQGWEDYFEGINIVGTFGEGDVLPCDECGYSYCEIDTDLPTSLSFKDSTTKEFEIYSECNITISTSEEWLKHFLDGNTLRIWCEDITEDATAYLEIKSGKNVYVCKVDYNAYKEPITPTFMTINCLAQTVTFNYNYQDYGINVKNYDSRLIIREPLVNGSFQKAIVQVPMNEDINPQTYEITFYISYEEDDSIHTYEETLEISQDQVYEEWRDNGNYICEGNASYHQLQRWTGTSYSSINTKTLEVMRGDLISSSDARCMSVLTKWEVNGNMCYDGSSYEREERMESYDNGETWQSSGEYRIGSLVEEESLECQRGNYLTIIPSEGGTFSFNGSVAANTLQYSTDGNTWRTLNGQPFELGTKIYLKGNCTPYLTNGIGTFSSSGDFTIEGNPLSLIYGDDFESHNSFPSNYAFQRLFNGAKVTDAYNLYLNFELRDYCYQYLFANSELTRAPRLPMTTLQTRCYGSMFENCASLTQAPTLPSTTLANECYHRLFYGCSSLVEAPNLEATTLTSNCYNSMFYGCSSLQKAPIIAATTLAIGSCQYMFYGCSSLVEAPTLLSATIPMYAYSYMFNGCYRLSYIKCLATSYASGAGTTNATIAWVSGVSGGGVFVKSSQATLWQTNVNGIPNGWAVQNE